MLTAAAARAETAAALRPEALPTTEAPAPSTRLLLNNLLAFRYNPLGFEDQIRLGLQRQLYRSESTLFRDNFVFGGIAPRINPAFVKIGPSLEIQPVSFFNLRLAAEAVGFFSTFGFLQSFESPVDAYSDSVLGERRTAKLNYSTAGGHLIVEPALQVRLGPLVVRDKLALEYWRMSVKQGDRVFYDVTLDTLISRNGWVVANDLDVLLLRDFKTWSGTFRGARLTAGARYTYVKPFYADGDFRPGDVQAVADNEHHRVGPLVAFTFFDHGYVSFNRPTALVIANWYVDHRFRTGADVSQAVPYFVAAFAFQSDLL
jgi:hypothetical protein